MQNKLNKTIWLDSALSFCGGWGILFVVLNPTFICTEVKQKWCVSWKYELVASAESGTVFLSHCVIYFVAKVAVKTKVLMQSNYFLLSSLHARIAEDLLYTVTYLEN